MENLVSNNFSYYNGKKIFVTGHTGFKGAWLLTWLSSLGAIVKGYALQPEDDRCLFNIVSKNITFENVFADIRDVKKMNDEIQDFQPDFIFHLAAQALVRASYKIPAETFDVNVVGTANLLESLIQLNKKCTVIVITTDKVYENREADYHYKESDVLGGHDPYSASKAATEIVVKSFRDSFFNLSKFENHKKAIASVRAGNVIGGGDWNQDRIIPDIIKALSQNSPVPVRNPHSVRPWQHVLEPLSGYLKLGILLDQNHKDFSGAYNFGPNPEDHLTVKDLVEIAISCWGNGKWSDESNPNDLHEANLLKLDITKSKKVLQWNPKLKSRDSIEWTINWYKQAPHDIFNYTLQQIKSYQEI